MYFKTIYVALAIGLIGTLTSCKKETEEVKPAPGIQTLVANAGADQNVLPITPVTLDGSASTGSGQLAYQWAVVRKPSNSTLTLGATTTMKSTFTPDIVGYYEFELTVTSGTEKSQDRIIVKAEYTTPITLNSDITTKTRLFDRFIDPAKADYLVTASVRTMAELTIDRDVVLAFDRDKRISIEKEGAIMAIGTADQRIRFTGSQAQKGFWAGITMYSANSANTLSFVTIEYAASQIAFTGVKAGLALYGTTKTQLNLTDCQFSYNDGYGLYVEEGTMITTFARNGFKNQTEAGVLMDAYNAVRLDAASTFTGSNGRDVVEISTSSIQTNKDVSWPAFTDKTPYRLVGSLTIEAGLTLQPGATVEVARDGVITVNKTGYLTAKGTADQKVTIVGAGHTAAYWKGIIIYSTNSQNIVDQVDISGGGSAVIVSGQRAAVTVYGKSAKLTVKNSRISNSGGYGIMYTSDADLNSDASTANTFEKNVQNNLYKL